MRQPAGFFVHNHFGQAVQRLRAENHVNIRRAFDDVFAFLRGDAAGNADDEAGVFSLSGRTRPKSENTFPVLFAHGTGVEQDDVGFVGLGNLFDAAVFFGKDGQHFSLSYSFIWQPKVRINTFSWFVSFSGSRNRGADGCWNEKFQTARRCRLKIGADYSTMWVWEAKYCFKI
ncbi:Uncharacterised protein [Neisseria gonorrhoeae]|uniref:Uncharacterized protein n=1 Tax=Neisseria gonorrhoeae TaxID=485 RepID=A0A378W0B0_NEIGO|nr:Uncharacterised protein [Neisseria gonorrhoeae]